MERADKLEYVILDNGLKAVINYVADSNVDYFGISFKAGSANENENEHGLAHFVEHTIFKGTSAHSANYILNRIEELGGELNAFTNKEETVVYTVCPAGHIDRCMSLVAEIVTDSVFPEQEIEKERFVIMEEIDSYKDSPSEAIFDELDELIFRGSSLAHNILGRNDTVSGFTTDDCRQWVRRHFTIPNSVVFYSGAKRIEDVIKKIEKFFSTLPVDETHNNYHEIKDVEPFDKIIEHPGYHQCHVATAFRIPGIDSEFRPELILLSNILGGPGMNSILNMSLREKRGLVYQVDATTFFYRNAGAFVIYYGCDKHEQKKCDSITEKEISHYVESPVSQRALSKAVRQYLGQMSIAYENREQRILSAVKSIHCRGRVDSYTEVRKRLISVSPESLHKAASFLSRNRLCRLTLK